MSSFHGLPYCIWLCFLCLLAEADVTCFEDLHQVGSWRQSGEKKPIAAIIIIIMVCGKGRRLPPDQPWHSFPSSSFLRIACLQWCRLGGWRKVALVPKSNHSERSRFNLPPLTIQFKHLFWRHCLVSTQICGKDRRLIEAANQSQVVGNPISLVSDSFEGRAHL